MNFGYTLYRNKQEMNIKESIDSQRTRATRSSFDLFCCSESLIGLLCREMQGPRLEQPATIDRVTIETDKHRD